MLSLLRRIVVDDPLGHQRLREVQLGVLLGGHLQHADGRLSALCRVLSCRLPLCRVSVTRNGAAKLQKIYELSKLLADNLLNRLHFLRSCVLTLLSKVLCWSRRGGSRSPPFKGRGWGVGFLILSQFSQTVSSRRAAEFR